MWRPVTRMLCWRHTPVTLLLIHVTPRHTHVTPSKIKSATYFLTPHLTNLYFGTTNWVLLWKNQYSRLFPNSSFKKVVPWDDKVRFNYESKFARNCSICFFKTKVISEFFVLFRLFLWHANIAASQDILNFLLNPYVLWAHRLSVHFNRQKFPKPCNWNSVTCV